MLAKPTKTYAQQEKQGEDESRIADCVLTMVSQMKFPKVSLKEAMIVLARGAAEPWLRVHGKLRRPEMSKKDAMELRECFELIDSEGSGAIAAEEVPLVFTVLGMDMKKQEIDAAVEEFNGERPIMEFPQYYQMMLSMVDKIPREYYGSSDGGKPKKGEYTLPFPFFAQAYRRRKLIEAVMGGDKPLQDLMNYRSLKAVGERQALRDLAAGKTLKPPKAQWSMTLEMTNREKKRARAATLKKPWYNPPKPAVTAPEVPSYVVDNAGPDVKELLLGEKRNDVIKAALDSEVKFVLPTKKSIEIDKPILSRDGSGKALTKAYLEDKLGTMRTDLQYKEAKKSQIMHVQAVKTLRDYYDRGAWQVKGSPLLYPASRRPIPKLECTTHRLKVDTLNI